MRIKSEVLDRKIVEVDELKSELLGRTQSGFRTLPERTKSASKNAKSTEGEALPSKPIVKNAIHRKSSARNSVQICQVILRFLTARALAILVVLRNLKEIVALVGHFT